jgi:hypothetical protein
MATLLAVFWIELDVVYSVLVLVGSGLAKIKETQVG